MNVRNKTILITGASSGIGRATAELLAAQGARLILTGRREKLLKQLADTLKVETLILPMDVRERKATISTLKAIPDQWVAIDVLVNNAGLALGLGPMDEGSLEDWERMIETNNLGLLAVTRTILPGMKARGRGHIVNISSIAGTYHYAGANVYGATKAFVTYFSLALRADLLGSPIRVTNIEPGMVETDFSRVRFKGDEEKAAEVYKGVIPMTAADIAETIRWAISQPAHVNINRIELMATAQAPSGFAVHRE